MGVLEEFGEMTPSEVRRQPLSPRKHGALRVIAFAEAANQVVIRERLDRRQVFG